MQNSGPGVGPTNTAVNFFGPGDDLWILLERKSDFFKRIDWLTHFLISKTLDTPPLPLAASLQKFIDKVGLPNLNFIESSPIPHVLVETGHTLPARGVLYFELSAQAQPKDWRALIEKISRLNVATARIFLPPHYSQPNLESKVKLNFVNLSEHHMRDAWQWTR